ncbi:unnamed protein product [Schistosoma margrebowiei]|uniref:Uncharacterized protein n=1 Tax=Schistosoma margrebowiei TaxID=48269 RepID=A0A183MZ95_9TREM|nr:unnamed protein product [Schistosoma margrebowiei]
MTKDLFIKLNGGRYFSKLDLPEAYLQVEVDEDSKELSTINTQHGFYRFNRLPFGVKPVPAILQQIMDTMVSTVEGVAVYLNDIVVVGSSAQELMRPLDVVLTKISKVGFQLQKEKSADASNYGIGAVISHRFPDGKEKPIDHVSQTLNSVERKYSQIEKEGLALVFAVKKFHK